MSMAEGKAKGGKLLHVVTGILIFGSVWGFFEATLGGYLNAIIFPNKGAIMTAIGMGIMSSALAIYRKPGMLPAIGLVAASFKILDVWLFALSPASPRILNPAGAIFLESLALWMVAVIIMDKVERRPAAPILAGVAAGFVSTFAYVYFALYVTNSPIFARLGISSIGEFVAGQGIVHAAFSGIGLPLGYLIGKRIIARPLTLFTRRPALYWASSGAVIAACWAASAIYIM